MKRVISFFVVVFLVFSLVGIAASKMMRGEVAVIDTEKED